MGQSKGKIHEVFKKRLDELTTNAEEQAKAGTGDGGRPWQVPTEQETSLLDVPKLHEPAFDREEANTNYAEIIKSGGAEAGTCGDTISLTMQVAYNAVEERAFRLRHASPVRQLVHGISSRKAHGNTKGVFGGITKAAEDILKAST